LKAMSNPRSIGGPTVLGAASNGLGYDTLRLRTVRRMLNGSEHGFDDVLQSQLAENEVKTSTKFTELVTAIVNKTRPDVSTTVKYRAKTAESVRLRLREMIAAISSIVHDPAAVLGTDPLSRYIQNAEERRRLKAALQARLEKYLFADISDADLASGQLVNEVGDRLVARMVL
jgi:hypothetical protein